VVKNAFVELQRAAPSRGACFAIYARYAVSAPELRAGN
jgi:hypothetical protein